MMVLISLDDAVREAHERLDEAVDLRGELESELLQLRDSSLQAVDDVEREPALGLAQHGLEYGLRLLAVRREGGLAFWGEELLESGQHEVLVAECRAHDHAHQLMALVHAVRAVGLELVEVAEVDEGDVVPADHEVAVFLQKTGTFFVSPVSALTTLSSHLMRLVVSSRSNTEEAALRTSPISSLK